MTGDFGHGMVLWRSGKRCWLGMCILFYFYLAAGKESVVGGGDGILFMTDRAVLGSI